MSIDSLGSLGELISAMVVLVSLIYISLQTRQTKIASQSQSLQARTDTALGISALIINSDDLARILAKLEEAGFPNDPKGIQALSKDEFIKYETFLRACILHLENMVLQQKSGQLEKAHVKETLIKLAASSRAQDPIRPAKALGLQMNENLTQFLAD